MFSVRGLLLALALAGLILTLPHPAVAQAPAEEDRYTLLVRDVPLSEALGRLVEVSRISLVYGPELDRSAPVYCLAREQTADDILRCIVGSAGKDFYRLSSGTYVIIEPAEEAPRRGTIAGMVVCAETGEPLPYANLLLADASAGTAANSAGLFVLSDLLPGEHRLIASFVGYTPVATYLEVPPAGYVRQQIALEPATMAAYPIVVDGLQQRLPSSDLGLVQAADEILRPRTGAQAIGRNALGLSMRSVTSSLHIQGGEAGEHQIQLDGVPVFEPLSLGRLFGAFSPLAVERINVRKAGFGAVHGSFTSGLVEMEHGLDPTHDMAVKVDPYALNARMNERFRLAGREAAVMLAGRYGLWDVWREPALEGLLRDWNQIDPLLMAAATDEGNSTATFSPHDRGSDLGLADIHAAASLKLTPFQTLRVSGFHGTSRVATDLFAITGQPGAPPDRAALTRDAYRWTNSAGHLRFHSLLGARALASVHLRASHHASRQNYAMTDRRGLTAETDFAVVQRELGEELDLLALTDRDNLNRLTEVAAEARLDVSLASSQLLELGLEAARVENRFDVAGPFYRSLRSENAAWRLAVFAQDRRSLGGATTLESGVRLTAVPDRQTVYAEPRLAVRYDADQYAFRLAGGLYRQFVNQFDVTAVGPSALVPSIRVWLPVDNSLAPPLALHLASEVLVTPTAGWQLRAEAYYKHLPRLLAIDYVALLDNGESANNAIVDQREFIARSRGFAYGAGARIERKGDVVRLRAGYDFTVSMRTFPSRFDGRLQPTPWSEPHRVIAAGDLVVFDGLVLRAGARAVWGRSWSFRQAYYDVLAAHSAPINEVVGLPESGTLPALYEVDLGATYSRRLAATRIEVAVDLLNVLDRSNVLDYGLRPIDPGSPDLVLDPRRAAGFHPLVSVRLTR